MHPKFEEFQTSFPHIHFEQIAAISLALPLAILICPRRDDELGPGKLHAANVPRGQRNIARDLTLRIDPEDPALTIYRRPHVSVDVNAEPIWLPRGWVLIEQALV